MINRRVGAWAVVVAVSLIFGANLALCQSAEEPFLPTWKLLKNEEKRQFIAGYMYGWRDAARVTDVAIEFVKSNPEQAVEGLEKVKSMYDLSRLRADTVTSELDRFFGDSGNKEATLSQAVTAVRKTLER